MKNLLRKNILFLHIIQIDTVINHSAGMGESGLPILRDCCLIEREQRHFKKRHRGQEDRRSATKKGTDLFLFQKQIRPLFPIGIGN